jgi:5'-methylthioadenosine phosphorylase
MARPVVGLIGGSGLQNPAFVQEPESKAVDTPYGAPSGPLTRGHHAAVDLLFLPRHGADHRIPPHRVNHRANLWALKAGGATAILATASSGSLKKTIRPGAFVIPHDFVAFWSIPTFHDDDVLHATPGLDAGLRDILATAAKAAGASARTRGVYVQTTGPRLETPAEIAHFATLGDVVGMTMASEATLANELGVRYAAVCSVDNYCNGIVERPLTFDQIRATQERNQDALVRIVTEAVEGIV